MPYAQDSAKFKSRDAASYDSLTAEFDRFTRRLTQPLAERMVDLANLLPTEWVLDLGTGTGIVALEVAARPNFSGRITAVDLSEGMLCAAKLKAFKDGFGSRLDFCRMDAEALGLESGSFDVALSLFALLHFPNPLLALRELFRVLRPGGRLVLAVGSGPAWLSRNGLTEGIKSLRRRFAIRRKKLLTGPSSLNALIARRLEGHADSEESSLAREGRKRTYRVPGLIREAGFRSVETSWCGAEAEIDTPEEFWDLQRTFSSVARKRLLDADPRQAEAVRAEFLRACREVQMHGGKLTYPYGALYAVAKRPPG
jgi:ubiquinone/menaquinone biosynthesis C-methylase UbiE